VCIWRIQPSENYSQPTITPFKKQIKITGLAKKTNNKKTAELLPQPDHYY
jgi:hypothetical protein